MSFEIDKVKKLLEPYNIFPQEIMELDGYASTNFRAKSEENNYLLKLYKDSSEYKLITAEENILNLLAAENLAFKTPVSIKAMHHYQDGSFSRLLLFIEGELLSKVPQTEALLHNFGTAAAQMNASLLDVENTVIQSRQLEWDMKSTLLNSKKLVYISDPADRKIVSYFLDIFEHEISPIQNELRHSIIHSDLNDNNIIVKGETLEGIIDFGDIAYSPLIYEVAIALTYIMMANEEDPFEKAKAFLQGYHKILPLEQEEIELLHILIPSRLCVSVCNSAEKKANGDDTEYVLISEKPAWQLLHKWLAINPLWIKNYFLSALDLETEVPELDPLLNKREVHTGRSLSTSYRQPIYMTSAAFQYMYDNLGNTYLDAYNNIAHVGHCHPRISKAITSQIRKLNTNTRYLYPQLGDYAAALTKTMPSSLTKIFYLNCGSAASDLAVRIAKTHTQNSAVAILKHGYHGNTQAGIAISDYKHSGKGGKGKPDNIITLPLPKEYNGLFPNGIVYAQDAITIISAEISKGNIPAALIVEPISGCGGQVPLAPEYLKTLAPFLKKHEILLIVDEVQVGFGRLGNYFWGFEMHDIIPDMVITGKSMGNGHPVAAVITSEKLADSFANGMEFFSSFGGNPVSCTVAMEVLNIIKEEGLQENAKKVGAYLREGLQRLQEEHDSITDVRGTGLFLGIEFTDKEGNPNSAMADTIKEELKQRFILVGTDGPHNNVIKTKPPLCFSKSNAEHFLQQFKRALEHRSKNS